MPKMFEIGEVKNGHFTRNVFASSSSRERMKERYKGQTDIYFSAYDYDMPEDGPNDFDHIRYDTLDFNSLYKEGDFYSDFDSADLTISNSESDIFIDSLVVKGVDRMHIRKYFSGAKGYHVTVPKEYFDMNPYNLHLFYHDFAEAHKKFLSLSTMDLKVYDSRRLFRVEGTINSKTGCEKTNVYNGEGDVTAEERSKIEYAFHPSHYMKTIEERAAKVVRHEGKQPIEPFAELMIKANPPSGERNDTAYTIALYLKDRGYNEEETFNILIGSGNTLEPRELLSTVRSAFHGTKQFGLNGNEIAKKYMDEYNQNEEERTDKDLDDMLVPWGQVLSNTRTHLMNFDPKELISYGIDNLDNYLGKIQRGELVVVGGTSGIGKSEFVWNIAKDNAKKGIPVGFIGLEMSPEQYALRSVRNSSGIDIHSFKTQEMTSEQRIDLNQAFDDLNATPLPIYFFNPKFGIDINKLERLIRNATQKYGIKIWVIDHLHYFPNSSGDGGDASADIAYIVTAIKQLTLTYNIPIVLVSHYRKIPYGIRPGLNSFKDSIVIPQVADTVLGLDRDQASDNLDVQRTVGVQVMKSRYGMACALLKIQFNPADGTYSSLSDFVFGSGDGLGMRD